MRAMSDTLMDLLKASYRLWCWREGYRDDMSADDLLAEYRSVMTEDQQNWLRAYIEIWTSSNF